MKKNKEEINLDFLIPLSVDDKIRLGPKRDGGYVVYKPSLLQTDILMTYGVGWDFNFEVDFHNLTGKKVYTYDPTMIGDSFFDKILYRKLIKKLMFKQLYKNIKFAFRWKKKIENLRKNDVIFYSEGIACKQERKYDTFQSHLKKNSITTEKILLKIDIEENEYDIFSDVDFFKHLNDNVVQIIIEFHNLKNRLRELKQIVQRLKESFEIVHIHGNNNSKLFTIYRDDENDICFPDLVELTFVKKESILPKDILTEKINYPCPGLDYPNIPFKPDFIKLTFQSLCD